MTETDSFIEEVTEEVRRDKLFAIFRRYGWIAILGVVLVVGGAAFNEWRKARDQAAAQTLGDTVMNALEVENVTARADALGAITVKDESARVFLSMLEAAARAEADNRDAALTLLDKVAADTAAPETYRQLARLKAVILRGSDQDREARMAVLDDLAVAGNPFRALAMEQKALALFEYGDNGAAIELLTTLLDEPGATPALLQRAQQLIVALGGDLSNTDGASGDNG
ncbi:MAG: hypothetical protein GXP03_05050 [Alphaproteobacteria bacterium]|nr:hypothetical protein [Alphaproteobacteria bacterium]